MLFRHLLRHVFISALLVLLLSSCAVISKKYNSNLIHKSILGSPLFESHFTGFALYDPEEKAYIYTRNADKYFTPASNTKLFTFYAGLKLLGDSIPALKYVERGDSLILWGTGDPTLLHPDFPYQPIIKKLKNTDKELFYASGNFTDAPFGSGWAWDDYEYYFQSERSGMPMYGNVVSFTIDSITGYSQVTPSFFYDFIDEEGNQDKGRYPQRHRQHNIFKYTIDPFKSSNKNRIPFQTSDELVAKFLSDTIGRPVKVVPFSPDGPSKLMYSGSTKHLYAMMLKKSDNFLAEQILYLCASTLGDTLRSGGVRNYITKKYLSDFENPPIWIDGSGLSRYNLFTPRSLVQLLEKIQAIIPEDKLGHYLPVGGVDGTLKNSYKSETDEPYVFAKTGTLSNNHSLSGFIKTKSGKLLIFSFMNNNYGSSSSPVKLEMEKTLRIIRERY